MNFIGALSHPQVTADTGTKMAHKDRNINFKKTLRPLPDPQCGRGRPLSTPRPLTSLLKILA